MGEEQKGKMKKLLRKWLGLDAELKTMAERYEARLREALPEAKPAMVKPVAPKVEVINRPKRWTDFRSIIERQGNE